MDDFHAPGGGQSIPSHESVRIFSNSEFARFLDGLLDITTLQIPKKLFVIPSNGRIGRQIEDIW